MNSRNYKKLIEEMTGAYVYGKIILDESDTPDDIMILDINKSFEKITGSTKDFFINKKVSEILPWIKSESPEFIRNCGRSAMTGENVEFEQYMKQDGKWLSIHVSSQEKYHFSAIIADITGLKKIERERTEHTLLLNQRVKEMNLLVQLSLLMQKPDLTLEMFFRETVNIIPSAFSYPEITEVRIRFRDFLINSCGYRQISSWILSEDIKIRGELSGSIEVCYIAEKDDMDEGPFLQEELRLINTLTRYVEKIIEKIEADEAVRQSRMKLQQYMEHAPDSILVADKTGHYIEVNPAACTMLGYTEQEILNMSISDLLPPEKKEAGIEAFRRLTQVGQYRRVFDLLKKDGNVVSIELESVKLPDGTFMAFCKDITERKKSEKKLIEMASFHKTLLDTIPVPVFYKDTNGKYLGMNRHYTDYFGVAENDMIGKYASDILNSKFVDIVKVKDDDLCKSKGIQIYESQVRDYKGNMHDVIFHKAVFKDANENPDGIVGVILDITERKKYQNDLELYFRAFQSVDQPVIITDRYGDIIEVNSAFSKIYGYSKESIKGQNPRFLNPGRKVYQNFGYSDEEYDELFGGLWKDIFNPAVGTWENNIINKKIDGSLIWIKLIINAVYGKNGDLLHFIALPIDISSSMQHVNLTKIQLYQMIASLSELRDNETGNHMRRVGIFSKLLARAYKKSEKYCNDIEIFSQLHDIGKVGILDSILLADRKLTDEEMKIMQTHTVMGYNIVKGIKEMEMAAAITLNHHERFDGMGYPVGLIKEDIPLSARITAIADVYDSLRSERTYKHEWPHEHAKKYIFQNTGVMFDPVLVDLFANLENNFEAIYNDLKN
jgi:PAS domain S-box-containing protein